MIIKTSAVWTYPGGRQVCRGTASGMREYQSRLMAMVKRQRGICLLCNGPIRLPTFDHQIGRGMGGSNRDDRIQIDGQPYNAAVCYLCNGAKASKRMDYHKVSREA